MRVFNNAETFNEAAREWLAQRDHENNLILSSVRSAIRRGLPARAWLIDGDAGPELALFQTPPHFLHLSQGEVRAAQAAADALKIELPGAGGPAAVADAFVERFNRQAILHAETTFYTLDRIERFTRPPGAFRRATLPDFGTLAPMAAAAARDMNLPAAEQLPAEVEKRLRQDIAEERQFLWSDGGSVRALASYTDGLDDRGARIRGVYTPPELRGRGYGTAVTGALAELLLTGGQAWVALFADNANPASTRIYRRLGFTPQFVYRAWRFVQS